MKKEKMKITITTTITMQITIESGPEIENGMNGRIRYCL